MRRDHDRELAAQVLDRAAVQLARARLADAHPDRGLTQRQRVPVIASENLALTRRQALQRALDAAAQVLMVVAVTCLIVLGRPVTVAGLEQHVQRERLSVRADLGILTIHDGSIAPALAA